MGICNRMLVCVPSSETKIQSTHESDVAIDEAQLFMMRPVQDDIVSDAV